MLIGIAINPDCFGPEVVVDEPTRRGAECVLNASLSNGVLIGSHDEDLLRDIAFQAERIRPVLGQQVQMLSVEAIKSGKDSLVRTARRLEPGISHLERLRRVAVDARPDIVVCASADQVGQLRDLDPRIELCSLADFPLSKAEGLRKRWASAQRLDRLPRDQCDRLVGSAIRFSEVLTIADSMIGRAAKDGVSGRLRKFARGVVYVAEVWCDQAAKGPGRRANIRILTQAGATGARSGYVDPKVARQAIVDAVRSEDKRSAVGNLEILLKQESDPPTFMDRLLASGRYVWGIRHGIDHIGSLAERVRRRSPTYIDTDSESNRELLREILALQNADQDHRSA